MRIALVTVPHPSARGGAEVFYEGLEDALRGAGHAVEVVPVACDESTFEGIREGYRAAEALDLSAFDAVISTKAPSFALHHPRHVSYLVHTIRVFYDMFESWTDGSAASRAMRDEVHARDFRSLGRIPDDRRFVIGVEPGERLHRQIGLRARPLHPGLRDSSLFRQGPYEHVLHVGRLHAWKRVDLALEAFRRCPADVPLLVAGTGSEEGRLRELAREDPRIRFLGEVDRAELRSLYARARAVLVTPIREDFGYVVLEAGLAGKPVLTCRDSGEPARVVAREGSGVVSEPRPEALARDLSRLLEDPGAAAAMGSRGRSWAIGVRWDRVAGTLLGALERPARTAAGKGLRRPRVLVVDNQPIEPPVGGGRLRLHGLYSHLPADLDPVYLGTYDWRGPGYRCVSHGRLTEVTVPQSAAHFAAHEALQAEAPALTPDVTFPLLSVLSTAFSERLAYEVARADAVIVSHPWAYPGVRRVAERGAKPLVYDAQNVEGRLKAQLLGGEGVAGDLAAACAELEGELCRDADLVLACSAEDAEAFRADYGIEAGKIRVIPNGVDTRSIRPATEAGRRAARLRLGIGPDERAAVFVGSRYPPNVEAARFVVESLAPALPHVRFLLVGGCTDLLERFTLPANVVAPGEVPPDVRDACYAAADVALNPMSRGSGTNIKMLDFLAAGLPCVTTPAGARGLEEGRGTAWLVADLTEFAASVARLIGDPDLRARTAAAARALAETRYDWSDLGREAGGAVRALLLRSRAHPPRARRGAVRPPKVAILSTWRTRCGIADYTEMLVGSLPVGADVVIYAERTACGAPDGPRVRKNWTLGARETRALAEDLATDRPDVLLVQHNPGLLDETGLELVSRACREHAVKLVVTLHAARFLDPGRIPGSPLATADRLYVHRVEDAAWLRDRGVAAPIRAFAQGIPRLPPRSIDDAKRVLGLDGRTVVGHFGFARPHKGTLELIGAFDWLAPALPALELLLLTSEYPSGDSRDYLAACARRIACSPFRDRIHASADHLSLPTAGLLLQACDLVVFPYGPSQESSSAAVRLALAAGRPVLVSRSGIFLELEGTAEFVADPEPGALASEIADLLADRDRRSSCCDRVTRFAARRTWPRVAASLWGDLRALASAGGEAQPAGEAARRSGTNGASLSTAR